MLKTDELERGCMAAARPDEMTFVLLARDPAAPAAIRGWCAARIGAGLNRHDDPKILEAMACAATMERQRGMTCWHPLASRRTGPRLPDVCGSHATDVCLNCGAYRLPHLTDDRWRPGPVPASAAEVQ